MKPPAPTRDPYPAPSWVLWLWRTPWLWLAIIIPLFCVPLFIGLDRRDFENDEAIYSFAVETMLKDGDWLTPKSIPSETSAFLEKPPLKFWITYVPIRLGLLPTNEFGMRFMDAALSALAFLYVFGIGRKLAGPVCGLVAVLLLFTHNMLLYHHGLRSNNMESTTVLAYAAGVYHFLAWRSVNPDVKRHIYAMSLWFVVGFMTKFVAALFLPVVLGMAALVKREDRGRLYRDRKAFALAGGLAVALIAPWFVYQYVERGPRLIDIMFGAHVVKRFTAHLDPDHLHSWSYYFTQLWAELGTAGTQALVAVAAILFLARVWLRRWIEGIVIVLWFVIPMAAISTGTSKLYHYAYPFLAPVALVGGWLVAVVAAQLFAWTAGPFASAVRGRDAILPAWMKAGRLQMSLTVLGLFAIVVAAVTAVFGRIHLTVGSASVRNSSILKPAAIAALTWLVAAPPQILRAAVVGALIALALPLAAYDRNVDQARRPRRILSQTRACVASIFAERATRGRQLLGTKVVSTSLSHIPFYYLRGFGPVQQRSTVSDAEVVSDLSSDIEPRLVIVPTSRYYEIITNLANNKAAVLAEASRQARMDPAGLEARLGGEPVGLMVIGDATLMLPVPYASCGEHRVRLISQ